MLDIPDHRSVRDFITKSNFNLPTNFYLTRNCYPIQLSFAAVLHHATSLSRDYFLAGYKVIYQESSQEIIESRPVEIPILTQIVGLWKPTGTF